MNHVTRTAWLIVGAITTGCMTISYNGFAAHAYFTDGGMGSAYLMIGLGHIALVVCVLCLIRLRRVKL